MIAENRILIEGVVVSPLKIIMHPKGEVLQAIKSGSYGYDGFGEAYFSLIKKGEIKGWKKHLKMTLNLIVPEGEIQFVVYDDRENSPTKNEFFQTNLSKDNYCRLTISPGLWVGFQGLSNGTNLLLNVANIEHDPDESRNLSLEKITYEWD
jgi:dTDP-4-dehydrorhamnose 3,5-epimerase